MPPDPEDLPGFSMAEIPAFRPLNTSAIPLMINSIHYYEAALVVLSEPDETLPGSFP